MPSNLQDLATALQESERWIDSAIYYASGHGVAHTATGDSDRMREWLSLVEVTQRLNDIKSRIATALPQEIVSAIEGQATPRASSR